jgi:hypothetical protein
MSKTVPTPIEAKASLVQRLSRVADRVRANIPAKFGARPKKAFLVWTHWTGEERGEGVEFVFARVEVLPIPVVSDLTSISRRSYSIGQFPEGSIRVSEISFGKWTYDMLTGLRIPTEAVRMRCGSCCSPVKPLASSPVNPAGPCFSEMKIRDDIDFWWEIVEDGRGDEPPLRTRYRVLGAPDRDIDGMQWVINLEAASESLSRLGAPQIGNDADTQQSPTPQTEIEEDEF